MKEINISEIKIEHDVVADVLELMGIPKVFLPKATRDIIDTVNKHSKYFIAEPSQPIMAINWYKMGIFTSIECGQPLGGEDFSCGFPIHSHCLGHKSHGKIFFYCVGNDDVSCDRYCLSKNINDCTEVLGDKK